MIGWDKKVIEPAQSIVIPPATNITAGWVTLVTWDKAEAQALLLTGPATLYGHVGADLGDTTQPGAVQLTFPKDIKTQWLRSSADGLTQRMTWAIGTNRKWAQGAQGPEYLTFDDFPLRFQVWQEAGVMRVTKVITVIEAPDSRIGERIRP